MLRFSLVVFILGTGLLITVPNTASAAANAPAASANPTESKEPGWLGVVVARGDLKQWIKSTPIEERPNRPLHFYGNAVRRQYYRGNSTSRPADAVKGAERGK